MEEGMNRHFKDGFHQNNEDIGIEAELGDETLTMGTVDAEERFEVAVIGNGVENGEEEKGSASSSSSSSDDEEAEVVLTEKTDDESAVIYQEENGASDLVVGEEAAEIESSPVTELKVVEEDNSELVETAAEEKGYDVEEEREVTITEESQPVEAVVVELADVVPDHVESAEEVLSTVVKEREVENADHEGGNENVKFKEDDSFPATAKLSNETSHKTEIPETNGNPQIISISARTMQPTSWRGCCGLLEVFKRDR